MQLLWGKGTWVWRGHQNIMHQMKWSSWAILISQIPFPFPSSLEDASRIRLGPSLLYILTLGDFNSPQGFKNHLDKNEYWCIHTLLSWDLNSYIQLAISSWIYKRQLKLSRCQSQLLVSSCPKKGSMVNSVTPHPNKCSDCKSSCWVWLLIPSVNLKILSALLSNYIPTIAPWLLSYH